MSLAVKQLARGPYYLCVQRAQAACTSPCALTGRRALHRSFVGLGAPAFAHPRHSQSQQHSRPTDPDADEFERDPETFKREVEELAASLGVRATRPPNNGRHNQDSEDGKGSDPNLMLSDQDWEIRTGMPEPCTTPSLLFLMHCSSKGAPYTSCNRRFLNSFPPGSLHPLTSPLGLRSRHLALF
jgi:hypothetical protein